MVWQSFVLGFERDLEGRGGRQGISVSKMGVDKMRGGDSTTHSGVYF